MSQTFSTARASKGDRRDGVVVGIILAVVGLALLPVAGRPGPEISAIMPAYFATVSVTALLTAYLLLAQLRRGEAIEFAPLAAAYLFSGLFVVPRLLTIFRSGAAAGSDPLLWLWTFRHCGFPALLLAYVAMKRSSALRHRIAAAYVTKPQIASFSITIAISLLVLILLGLTMIAPRLLPPLAAAGGSDLFAGAVHWAVLLLNIATLLAVASSLGRRMSHLDVWLSVVAMAELVNVTLSFAATSRYSLGWYGGRLGDLVSATVVLGSFMREILWLYRALIEANARLSTLATNDALTGLPNRRSFDEMMQRVLGHGQRSQTDLSLIMIDIDRFKGLNDAYGHQAGDRCLAAVARAVAQSVRRPLDFVARYGGEEFVAILPDTGEAGALDRAHAMLKAVRDLALPNKASEFGIVTVSMGLATLNPRPWGAHRAGLAEALIAAADRALYDAKNGGRNSVAIGSQFLPDNAVVSVEALLPGLREAGPRSTTDRVG